LKKRNLYGKRGAHKIISLQNGERGGDEGGGGGKEAGCDTTSSEPGDKTRSGDHRKEIS
jgi:hypothetical protein